MTYCRFCWRVFWASASVLVLGCENPDLAYVELPNEPRRDDDASVTSELDEITTAAVVVVTSETESSVQPANTKTPESSNPARPADADVVDAAAVTSVDASLPNAEHDAAAQDADRQSETTTSSSHSADAEPVVPADAQGDGDSDAEEEASIICDCPDEVNPCLTALCLAGLTICTFTPRPGAACDDGNSCTQSDTCDDSGECGGTPKDCSDKDGVCVEGVCNEDNGKCEAKPSAKNTECDDEDRCSLDDACDGKGACKGKPRDCSSLDSSCTEGACDEDNGECVAVPANVGDGCDDEDKCTEDDVCDEDGKCGGEVVDCSEASGVCAVGVCDAKDGKCKPEPLSGIACDDGDACTTLDACDEGECKGQEADDCGDAGWLDLASGSASITMSNECASDDFDVRSQVPDDSDCDRASGDDVVFMLDLSQFDAPVTVRASTSHEATEFDTVLYLMAQQCADDALIACVDDSDGGFTSTLEVRVEPGVYALVVDAYRGNDEGVFHLDVVIEE